MRDVRFDIMRGIGILLMMLGHIPIEGVAYNVIYSFHMPMFFILAGYFAKDVQLNFRGGIRVFCDKSLDYGFLL